MPADPQTATLNLEQAYAGFDKTGNKTGCFLTLGALIEAGFSQANPVHLGLPWVEKLQQLVVECGEFPSVTVEATVLASLHAFVHILPHHPLVIAFEARGDQLLSSDITAELKMKMGLSLSWLSLQQGDFSRTRAITRQLTPLIHTAHPQATTRILWHITEGNLAWLTANFPLAMDKFSERLNQSRHAGTSMHDCRLWMLGISCALAEGNPNDARMHLEHARRSLHDPQNKLIQAELNGLRAGVKLLEGNVSSALQAAREGLTQAEETGACFLAASARIGLAQILIETGATEEADNQLTHAIYYADSTKACLLKCRALLVAAYAQLRIENEFAATNMLQEALAIAARHNYLAPDFWWRPRVMSLLLSCALRNGIETCYVQHLIRHRGLLPSSPDNENWPWPIRIYTFGRFSILCNDQPLRFDGKSQRKPMELLKYLCSFGGRAISQNQIMDALWPESSGDVAGQALRTTLHRLRKMLQHEKAVRLENRQLSLDINYVWIDYLTFLRVAHQPNATQVSLQVAINRYQGRFLAEEPESWIISFRERLHLHYLNMSEQLGLLLECNNDWVLASRHYLKAIGIDPLAEMFYRRHMICCMQLEQHYKALSTYQCCQLTLFSHLGMRPSRETELLFQSLVTDLRPANL